MLFAAAATPAASQWNPADRAYALVGTWSCQSAANGSATMTYVRQPDGLISLKTVFSARDGQTGEFDEAYTPVLPAAYWSWKASRLGRDDFAEAGTAGMWTAQKWFFDGTINQKSASHVPESHRLRMIYTWLGDNAFQREFEVYQNGVWSTTTSSLCKRASP